MNIKKIISYVIVITMFASVFALTGQPAEAKVSEDTPKSFANIVLFAHFSGSEAAEDAAFFADKANRDKIISIYDGTSGRSFKNYMSTISYGKFNVKNIFPQDNGTSIDSYQLSISKSSAQNTDVDYTIIKELLMNVPDIQNKTVDYDGDGYIDNLTIILRGGADRESGLTPSLYPHKSNYNGTDYWSDKNIYTYNILNTYRLMEETLPERSGLVAHEFLHSLGYPDLYKNDGSSEPVSSWDIMGGVSQYVNYPLAYLRMKFSGWLDIDTVTSSCTLTLHNQNNAGGNQAYILKSPLNEQEFFVVEFRKKPPLDPTNTDTIDAKIGGSGVIVYRIDTTVDRLSSHFDKNGVYVFRPQPGQIGYDSNERACILNAFLSAESGRTSIGSGDLNKGLTDGALTFSDGTNSGITISNVSSSSGDFMTLSVIIPEASLFDTWTDTQYSDVADDSYKDVSLTARDDIQYLMTYAKGAYTLYTYDGSKSDSQWVKTGSPFSEANSTPDQALLFHGNDLYFGYISPKNDTSDFILKKYNTSTKTWSTAATITDSGSSFGMKSINGGLYIATAKGDSSGLYKLNGSSFENLGNYFNGLGGQPKICGMNGQIYVSIRNANNRIELYKYNAAQSFTKVSDDSVSASSYDMISLENKIYIALGSLDGNGLKMVTYDGTEWSTGSSSNIECYSPDLAVSQGKLYVLTSPGSDTGSTKIYNYDTSGDSYVQEGINVDGATSSLALSSSDNHLYAAYVQESANTIKVKTKKTTNELLSLTITPPDKTVYEMGEAVDTTGLAVTANYTKDTRLLTGDAYTLSGFDTYTVGQLQATVTYSGKSNTFMYEVQRPSGMTNEDIARIMARRLIPPTSTSTNLYGHDDFIFSWSKTAGATGYYVYYKKSASSSWSYLGSTMGTYIRKANLTDGVSYHFRVYPYIECDGVKCKSDNYKEGSKVYSLKQVSRPALSKSSRYYVKVRWTNIAGESGYQIARSKYKTKKFSIVKTCSYKYKTTTVKAPRYKTYYYKIRAYKVVNGKKIYAPWSSVRAYKLK